jgi:hypothetical protein
MQDRPRTEESFPQSRYAPLVFWIGFSLCAVLYLLFLLPGHTYFGFGDDPAIYIVSAKALLAGEGYRSINYPEPTFARIYPIGYPLLLLPAVFIGGENSVLTIQVARILSFLFALGFLYLSWRYLRTHLPPLIAALVPVAVGLTPLFYTTVTTIGSEWPFGVAVLLGALLLHRAEAEDGETNTNRLYRSLLFLAGLCFGAAMLFRSIAFTLVVGIGFVYLLRRYWQSLLFFAAGVGVLFLPWMIYSSLNGGGSFQYYIHQFQTEVTVQTPLNHLKAICLRDAAVFTFPLFETNAVQNLLSRLHLTFLVPVWGLIVTLLILRGAFAQLRRKLPLAWGMLFYTLLIIVWPYTPERFLLPVLPFYAAMLFEGFGIVFTYFKVIFDKREGINSEEQKKRFPKDCVPFYAVCCAVTILCGIAVNQMWLRNQKNTGHLGGENAAKNWQETQEALRFIRENTPSNAIVVSSYSYSTYLFTGRKTLDQLPAEKMMEILQKHRQHPLYIFMTYRESHAEYNLGEDYGMKPVKDFMVRYPRVLTLLWESDDATQAVYQVSLPQ